MRAAILGGESEFNDVFLTAGEAAGKSLEVEETAGAVEVLVVLEPSGFVTVTVRVTELPPPDESGVTTVVVSVVVLVLGVGFGLVVVGGGVVVVEVEEYLQSIPSQIKG